MGRRAGLTAGSFAFRRLLPAFQLPRVGCSVTVPVPVPGIVRSFVSAVPPGPSFLPRAWPLSAAVGDPGVPSPLLPASVTLRRLVARAPRVRLHVHSAPSGPLDSLLLPIRACLLTLRAVHARGQPLVSARHHVVPPLFFSGRAAPRVSAPPLPPCGDALRVRAVRLGLGCGAPARFAPPPASRLPGSHAGPVSGISSTRPLPPVRRRAARLPPPPGGGGPARAPSPPLSSGRLRSFLPPILPPSSPSCAPSAALPAGSRAEARRHHHPLLSAPGCPLVRPLPLLAAPAAPPLDGPPCGGFPLFCPVPAGTLPDVPGRPPPFPHFPGPRRPLWFSVSRRPVSPRSPPLVPSWRLPPWTPPAPHPFPLPVPPPPAVHPEPPRSTGAVPAPFSAPPAARPFPWLRSQCRRRSSAAAVPPPAPGPGAGTPPPAASPAPAGTPAPPHPRRRTLAATFSGRAVAAPPAALLRRRVPRCRFLPLGFVC
ncbi:PREDICTED: basic proline-rich protein-like, partial [Ipomoea nil]|uniref:basic proline-rich protein-like n=1 Tax=Ipomoea nil TaxID=35883 RepID=UPI0009016ABF